MIEGVAEVVPIRNRGDFGGLGGLPCRDDGVAAGHRQGVGVRRTGQTARAGDVAMSVGVASEVEAQTLAVAGIEHIVALEAGVVGGDAADRVGGYGSGRVGHGDILARGNTVGLSAAIDIRKCRCIITVVIVGSTGGVVCRAAEGVAVATTGNVDGRRGEEAVGKVDIASAM